MTRIEVSAPDGAPDIRAGADLVDILLGLVDLLDGDVVAVTSKVVSKAEGRVRRGSRDEVLAGETVRVVARRGNTTIVRNRLGLTMAAAGIDSSNVEQGHVVLLPEDPDASARAIRAGLLERSGRNVAVIVTDTAGRTWREGQTDLAIGAAGLVVCEDHTGRTDAHGNLLAVTAPAVADEIAGMAELAQGKLGARPFAVVRGRPDLVLPVGDHGPGAAALVRAEGTDLFGYGAREAVVRALGGDPADRAPFGAPASPDELAAAVTEVLGVPVEPDGSTGDGLALSVPDGLWRVVEALAFAHGWEARAGDPGDPVRLHPTRV